MANIASSKKDARRSAVRALKNRSVKSAVKTKVSKSRRGLTEAAEDAGELVLTAVAALDRAAAKGILHRNNAARRKSRLMQRLNSAGTQTPVAPRRGEKPAAAKGAGKRTPGRGATSPKSRAKK